MDVGFVEGDEEEGEDLVDFDEEDLRFLVVFCSKLSALCSMNWLIGRLVRSDRTSTFNLQQDSRR